MRVGTMISTESGWRPGHSCMLRVGFVLLSLVQTMPGKWLVLCIRGRRG